VVSCLGFRVWGSEGFRVKGLGFGVQVKGLGCWVQGKRGYAALVDDMVR